MTIGVVSLLSQQTLHLTIPDYLSKVDVCTFEQISSTFLRLYIHNGMDEQQR